MSEVDVAAGDAVTWGAAVASFYWQPRRASAGVSDD